MIVDVFYLLCVFSLLFNASSDFKTREIDSRFNWLMFGASFIFIMFLNILGTYLVVLLATAIASLYLLKSNVITEGDLEALVWVVPAIGLMGLLNIFVFIISILASYSIVFMFLLAKFLKKGKKEIKFEIPFYPLLLFSFVIAVIL